MLVFAGFKWSAPVPGGTLTVLERGLSSIQGLRRAPLPQGPESGLRELPLTRPVAFRTTCSARKQISRLFSLHPTCSASSLPGHCTTNSLAGTRTNCRSSCGSRGGPSSSGTRPGVMYSLCVPKLMGFARDSGAVWLIVLWVWDTFPPSVGGSFVLFLIHAAVLARVFRNGEKRA